MTYDKELEFAQNLALEAGKVMLEWFKKGTTKEWKHDTTPVTEADIAINRMVIERIAASFPADNVLGEEESAHNGGFRTWVCDPIDGTVPFAHGLPISTFVIALVIDGAPVLGVVYDPFLDRLFYAVAGHGAFVNTTPIRVSSGALKNSVVDATGFSLKGNMVGRDPNFIYELHNRGCIVTTAWSSVITSMLVANGQYAAILTSSPYPHDGATSKIIVEEAGGKVTDLFGNDQRYDQPTKGFVASNGVVHDELLALLKTKSPVA